MLVFIFYFIVIRFVSKNKGSKVLVELFGWKSGFGISFLFIRFYFVFRVLSLIVFLRNEFFC